MCGIQGCNAPVIDLFDFGAIYICCLIACLLNFPTYFLFSFLFPYLFVSLFNFFFQNWPAPFLGWMSYEATRPGFSSYLYFVL